jgi:VCBS repeat-containing protein
LLENDTDEDENPLSADLVNGPSHGILDLNADGSFSYTPDPNFNGTDFFTYVANDGQVDSNMATVFLTVTPVNDGPVANDDTATTLEDTGVTIAVLTNDTDMEGDLLTVSAVGHAGHGSVTLTATGVTYTPAPNYYGSDSFAYTVSDGQGGTDTATVTVTVTPANDAPTVADDAYATDEDTALIILAPGVLGNDSDVDGNPLTAVLVAAPAYGSLSLNSDGELTYTPSANFNGSDSFTYTANDGSSDSNIATVAITVTSVNDGPVATDDSATTPEDTSVTVAVLANDSDAEGNSLTVAAVTQGSHGSVAINPDGTVSYTPAANYHGPDSFTYTASDGVLSDTAMVSVTVSPVNDAPVAQDDSYLATEDTTLIIAAPGVLNNDTDVDGDSLSAVVGSAPTHGTLSLAANGSFEYTPAPDYTGADSFTYTLSDGELTDTATVSLTIGTANDAPVAQDDSVTTAEDTAVVIPVLANDTDADGNSLTVTTVSDPANGSTLMNPDGTVTYTPDTNFDGADSFTYTASDGQGGTDTATVTVTVTPVNDAPVANDDSYDATEDTARIIAAPGVLGNDTDVDGDALTATVLTAPAHGTLTLDANGSFTYTPATDYTGSDSFTYTASDGQGGSDSARVSLTIGAANDAPVATDDAATTPEDTVVSIAVLANDTDGDGNPLSVASVTQGSHGSVTFTGSGVVYTPNLNFNGTDTFAYTASDGQGGTDTATVNVTVTPVNDAPAADAGPDVIVNEGQLVSRAGAYSDVDAGDTHTFQWVVTDVDGNIRSVSDTLGLTFTPADDDGQPYAATFTVTDSAGATATDSFRVQVLNVAPTADAGPDQSVAEGSSVAVAGSFMDPSPADTFTFLWDFGDGSTADTLNATHAYAGSGTYIVTLTVTDDDGGAGSDTLVVTVSGGGDTGTIGDFVWHDLYHRPCHLVDGIQDTGEPGIAGVLVNLLDAGQTVVASTLTDASGLYQFTGLEAGTYFVEIASDNFQSGGALDGWYATLQDRGTDEAEDGDGDLITHRSDPVVLTAGESDFDIDFGFFTTGIDLTKTGPETVKVSETITYHFRLENTGDVVLHGGAQVYDSLINPCGDHQIWSGILQPGQVIEFDRAYSTTMNDGIRGEVINTATAVGHPLRPDGVYLPNVTDVDRWVVEITQALEAAIDIEKYVMVVPEEGGKGGCSSGWIPADGFGMDADEAPGLKAAVGEKVQFTYVVTNPGEVALRNVKVVDDHGTPGKPCDDFSPNAVSKTGKNIGDKDRDGLLDPGESWYYTWTTVVTEGQHFNSATASAKPAGGGITVTDADPAHWFGVVPCTASIGNFVWKDQDKDGIQDAGELGLKGVVVNLLDASGRKVVSTTTNDQGFYQFTDLAAGIYSVEIACKNFVCGGVLVGWYASPEDQGSAEAKDSDGDRVTHRSDAVKLSAGESNTEVDFGFFRYSGCGTGKGNNGVGNGLDPQPPGNPPINDGVGTWPGHPGNRGFGHHRFGGIHRNAKQAVGPAKACVVDLSSKAAKPEQHHQLELQPCSFWVMPFVCDMEAYNPNKNIKIALSPAKDEVGKAAAGRKH